jgi:ParB family chromosome partitioning protein
LGDPLRASELARQAVKQGWSVREVERRVRKEVASGDDATQVAVAKAPRPDRDPGLREIEQALQDGLGTRVNIRPGKRGRGVLEITYHSNDDLERLVALMTGKETSEILG